MRRNGRYVKGIVMLIIFVVFGGLVSVAASNTSNKQLQEMRRVETALMKSIYERAVYTKDGSSKMTENEVYKGVKDLESKGARNAVVNLAYVIVNPDDETDFERVFSQLDRELSSKGIVEINNKGYLELVKKERTPEEVSEIIHEEYEEWKEISVMNEYGAVYQQALMDLNY